MSHPKHRSFVSLLLAPIERLDATPVWAKVTAIFAGLWQYAQHDMFTGAFVLIVISGIMDYLFGVKAAKHCKEYLPGIAHAGSLSKLMSVCMILLIRAGEFWANHYGVLNTKGIIATVIAISLFGVDIQSIAHHREKLGAKPIPLLSPLLNLLQRALRAVVDSRVPVPQAAKEDSTNDHSST